MRRLNLNSIGRSIGQQWQGFWFASAGPEALAFCRILFFAIVAWQYARNDFSAWGDVDPVFWKPVLLFRVLELPLLSTTTLATMQVVWKLALVSSCLGFLTRISTWIAGGLGLYLLGLINCFGKIGHQHQAVVLVLGVLALSRCGDAWSLDALWKPSRDRRRHLDLVECGAYTWPIRLTWLIFVTIFFAAGIYKLRASQIAWVNSDNLANLLIRAHYGMENVWNRLGLDVARHRWLCRLIAATALGLEVICPLALVSRHARRIIIPALFLMQAGIFVLMGTSFMVYLGLYAFWIPGLYSIGDQRDARKVSLGVPR